MKRLRRAVHFVPGGNEKMLNKSLALNADSLVLDLEDAVTPENKDSARQTVTEWLKDVPFGAKERMVRINPLDTPWGIKDLEMTMRGKPDSYLIPKVNARDNLLKIDSVISGMERELGFREREVQLIVLATETPQGLLNIREFGSCPRVDALSWGAEDLSAAIGARRNRSDDGKFLEVFRYARIMTLLSATAAGVQPIDTVFVDIKDDIGLREECVEGAWMGFTGKITIHPNQIEPVNEVFTPSSEEVLECQELLSAFEENQKAGKMAFSFRGQMVDVPHLMRARIILERAKQAAVLQGRS